MSRFDNFDERNYKGEFIDSFRFEGKHYEHRIFSRTNDRIDCIDEDGNLVLRFTANCDILTPDGNHYGRISTTTDNGWVTQTWIARVDGKEDLKHRDNLKLEVLVSERYVREMAEGKERAAAVEKAHADRIDLGTKNEEDRSAMAVAAIDYILANSQKAFNGRIELREEKILLKEMTEIVVGVLYKDQRNLRFIFNDGKEVSIVKKKNFFRGNLKNKYRIEISVVKDGTLLEEHHFYPDREKEALKAFYHVLHGIPETEEELKAEYRFNMDNFYEEVKPAVIPNRPPSLNHNKSSLKITVHPVKGNKYV